MAVKFSVTVLCLKIFSWITEYFHVINDYKCDSSNLQSFCERISAALGSSGNGCKTFWCQNRT